MRPTRIAVAVVFSLVLVACGRPDSGFDVTTLESAIPGALVPDDPSVVTDVSCRELPTSEATDSVCTALVGSQEIKIVTTISADGSVAVSTGAILLDISGVANEAGRRLTEDLGIESVVSCPGSVRVVVVGDTFVCQASDPAGPTHDILITVVDPSGAWTIDLAR